MTPPPLAPGTPVLVTGAGGFVGRHVLARSLGSQAEEVARRVEELYRPSGQWRDWTLWERQPEIPREAGDGGSGARGTMSPAPRARE
ncbi:MAG: hypothetical protein ACLF0P_00940 [Thermoanaerobaculia bacterium]